MAENGTIVKKSIKTGSTSEYRVEFDYEAQKSDELDLKKGDLITNVVITKMDGWWEGTLGAIGKRGIFPCNFVEVVTSNSSSSGDDAQSSGDAAQLRKMSGTNLTHARRLKALFAYIPEQESELHLEVGDEVDFIAEVEEGWWRGQLKGRTGIFPSNFVTELESTPTAAATLNGSKDLSKGEYGKQNEQKNRDSINIKVPPDVVPSEKPVLVEKNGQALVQENTSLRTYKVQNTPK